MSNARRIITRAIRALSGSAAFPDINAWSNPATWGGLVPQAHDDITIAPGATFTFDTLSNSLGLIQVNGTLIVSSKVDTSFIADRITIGSTGRLVVGSLAAPSTRRTKFTFTEKSDPNAIRGLAFDGPDGNTSTGNVPSNNRGFFVEPGGKLEIYSWLPRVTKTYIQGHHYAGAKTLTLADDVSDSIFPGDEISVSPTGFYRPDRRTEIFTVQSVSANTVTLASSTGLGYDRWGLMQYITDNGMSLTQGAYTLSNWVQQGGQWVNLGGKKPAADMPDTLDQRARVLLLTRRCQFLSPEDEEKQTLGHGHTMMTMVKPGDGGKTFLVGVESRRGGQSGRLGAYPFHCHANSIIPSTGQDLGSLDAGQVEFHGCVTNQSFNRGFTLHACQGVVLADHSAVNVQGHAIFLESGAEVDDLIYRCDVSGVYSPPPGRAILLTDRDSQDFYDPLPGYNSFGAAGLWCTNLANDIIENSFRDAPINGWISLTQRPAENSAAPSDSVGGCLGIARKVAIFPAWCPPKTWRDNTFQTAKYFGKEFQLNAKNERGDLYSDGRGLTFSAQRAPFDGNTRLTTVATRTVPAGTYATQVSPAFDGDVVSKANFAGYHNSANDPRYNRQTFSDNGAGQATWQANGQPIYVQGFSGTDPKGYGALTLAEAALFANDHKAAITGGYKQHGVGNDFAGTIQSTAIADRVHLIDTSLNNWDAPTEANFVRIGFDSYHYTLFFKNIHAIGYTVKGPPNFQADFRGVLKTSAVNGSWDFYLDSTEMSSRGMVNFNHTGAGPMLWIAPGPNISAQKPWVDWHPAGQSGETPTGRSHGFTTAILDWFGTLFKQGANRYGGPDHPFLTYDDPNVLKVYAADGFDLAIATTSTMRVGLEVGLGLRFDLGPTHAHFLDTAQNNMVASGLMYQRCAVSDFGDYTTSDSLGRKAQWLMSKWDSSTVSDIGVWSASGGGNASTSVPAGSVTRIFNPYTPTNCGAIQLFGSYNGGIQITRTLGGEWIILGVAADASKTASGTFNGGAFKATGIASAADLKAQTVSAIWKDPTARLNAPNGTVWMKLVMPQSDATEADLKWAKTLPLFLTIA